MENILTIMAALSENKAMGDFLEIVLTEKEREMMEERMNIFFYLAEGYSQRKVAEFTGAGIATVTRGAKTYKKNKEKIDYYLSEYNFQPTL